MTKVGGLETPPLQAQNQFNEVTRKMKQKTGHHTSTVLRCNRLCFTQTISDGPNENGDHI